MKKTLLLAAVVIGVHCIAISGLFLAQGCKTTKRTTDTSVTPPMPPLTAPAVEPAAIEPAPIVSEKAEGTIEYTVAKGDSLGVIAKRHNASKSEICALNKITDPNKIRVGQKLVIPKHSGYAATAATAKHAEKPKEKKPKAPKADAAEHTPSLAAGIGEYVVAAGDSLSKIASKFNCKISELREVNQLANDKLKIGQKLKLPAKKSEGAPQAPDAAPAQVTETPAAPAASPAPAAVTAPAATAAPAPAEAAPAKPLSSGITHTVMAGDDLNSISKLYVVPVDRIAEANQMGTNRTVQVGQKIIVPQP